MKTYGPLHRILFRHRDLRYQPEGIDPIFQRFRKQRVLTSVRPLNETPHPILPQSAREFYREIKTSSAFLHGQGQKQTFAKRHVGFTPAGQ